MYWRLEYLTSGGDWEVEHDKGAEGDLRSSEVKGYAEAFAYYFGKHTVPILVHYRPRVEERKRIGPWEIE